MNDEEFLNHIESWLNRSDKVQADSGTNLVFVGRAYVRRLLDMAKG